MSIPVETIICQSSVVGGQWPADDDGTITESGFYWRERHGVRVLVCKPLEDVGFVNGFSTRLGGVSDFPENSLNLAGFDEDSAENIFENRRRFVSVFEGNFMLSTAWQVHGDAVKLVRTLDDIRRSEDPADALVSDLNDIFVGVKTADCVPILIGDPVSKSYAAIHAGWKGTAAKIALNAIEKMKTEYAAEPKNMIAAIGPCASGENYEVGSDVIERFRTAFSDHEKYFRETRPGHALVDLPLVNRDLMVSGGVDQRNIYTAPFCTIARTDLFFSYRVEKKRFGKTGRLLSVIGRM